jgi:hypothetical protein
MERKRDKEQNMKGVVWKEQNGCIKTLQPKNPVGKKGLKGKLPSDSEKPLLV